MYLKVHLDSLISLQTKLRMSISKEECKQKMNNHLGVYILNLMKDYRKELKQQ